MNTTTITDKFVRSDDFAAKLDGLYLPNEAWSVFAQLEQATSAEELARQLEIPAETVLEAINALLSHGLIRKQLLNWREFLAQKGIQMPPANSAPATAPVAEARAAGRPGAALAGWPKPSAPRIETEPTPAPELTEIAPAAEAATAPDVDVAPTVATPPPPSEPEAAPSIQPASTHPVAELTTPPAAEPTASCAPATENPPPLFSDFKLLDPQATVASAETSAPASVQPESSTRTIDVVTPVPPSDHPPAHRSTGATPAAETILPVSFAIVNEKARLERKAAAAMTISFRLAAPVKESATSWRLKPLLNAIMQKAGGGLAGQLLVYRVFIHVPAEMMHAAGIQSLSLVDDSVIIRDRAFYDALCQAARAVASVDLRGVKA